MSQGKIKCDICGNGITLKKEKNYVVKDSLMAITTFNAIDCPFCGCQMVLKKRLLEVKVGDKK